MIDVSDVNLKRELAANEFVLFRGRKLKGTGKSHFIHRMAKIEPRIRICLSLELDDEIYEPVHAVATMLSIIFPQT